MYAGVNNHHRVRRHHHHHHRLQKDEVLDLPVDPHYQPPSAGSLRRHIAASLMRHHQSDERNKHALQPLSPASYSSSLEIAPYNPAATPDSSIELRGKIGESSYSFKTSTELLKVLNRIWSLEEQHASNISLVKALKNELDLARTRIKELLRDQQANRYEIDELMKQISEDNLARNSRERDHLDAALQSVRNELEDERKLRKRSESLHRKLARELFEVKFALSTSIKEVEKERKSNQLLEELCDEFAEGIREYAGQVQLIRQKSEMDWNDMADHDNVILHISESWLDERMQIKNREAKEQGNNVPKTSAVDKLRPDIEAFLTAQQIPHFRNNTTLIPRNTKDRHSRRRSLESIPETQNMGCEESGVPESHHIEPEEFPLSGRRKGQSPTSVQISEPQNTPREIDPTFMKSSEGIPTEISMLQKSDIYRSTNGYQRRKAYSEEGNGSNSKTVDKLMGDLLISESGNLPLDHEYKEVASASNNPALQSKKNASPIRQWLTSMASPEPQPSESLLKTQQQVKGGNSLKSKLQEPKLKGQRSRLKILKGSS